MWAVVVLMAVTIGFPIAAFPLHDADPSDILLENLEPEEVEALIDYTIKNLQDDIVAIYEHHLRHHHENIRSLQRNRREISDSSSPVFDHKYWPGYSYDLDVNDRESLVVQNMSVHEEPDSLNITKAFSINIQDMPFIYRVSSGLAYTFRGNKMKPLYLKNKWTESLTGCPCDVADSMDCACCNAGGCQCKQSLGHSGTACVKCGDEARNSTCREAEPKHLFVDSAVGFEHYNSYFDLEEGLIRTVVIAHGKKVSMYRIASDALENMNELAILGTMELTTDVTHLGYGEVFLYHNGRDEKVRVLVVFNGQTGVHGLYRIPTDDKDNLAGFILTWKAKGTEMQAWQSENRLMITVLDKNHIDVYELIVGDLNNQTMRYIHSLYFTEPIISWRSYRSGAWNYLIIVSRSFIKIYVQMGTYYRPQYDIKTSEDMPHFQGIVPVRNPRHIDRSLLLVGSGNQVAAYSYKGPRNELHQMDAGLEHGIREIYRKDVGATIADWSLGISFVSQDSPVVLVPSDSGMVRLDLHMQMVPIADPFMLQNTILQETANELENMYQQQRKEIEFVEERLAMSVEGKTEITADISIRDLKVEAELSTAAMDANKINIYHTDTNNIEHEQMYDDYVAEIIAIEEKLTKMSAQTMEANYTLNDAVSKQGSQRPITGTKTVISGLRAETMVSQEVTLDDARDIVGNSFPLEQTLRSMIRVNDTRIITGKKIFRSELNITHLDAVLLDEIPVSDIVTTDGAQEISGTVTMRSLRAHTITLPEGGTVGGIDISEQVVPMDGNVTLDQCEFTGGPVVKGNLEILSNTINNKDFQRMLEKSLRVSGGSVSGPLVFNGTLSIGELEAGAIMGVNTSEFITSTVFKNQPASMSGTLTVNSQVTIRGDMAVSGTLNGESFPGDNVLLRTLNNTVNFGSKRFTNVSFDSMWLDPTAKINGLRTSEIVTLDSPQIISGRKIFSRGVDIWGDLDIDVKRIDGVHLDELNASLSLPVQNMSLDLVFLAPVEVPALFYDGALNGINFTELAKDIVYDDESSPTLAGLKVFSGDSLHIRNADINSTFNGHRFDDIVLTSTESTIEGNAVFQRRTTFDTLLVNGTVDGVDLDNLIDTALYLDKPGQVVTGTKTIIGTVFSKELEANGKFSNTDFAKVLTKSGNQTFTAPQSFAAATFADVETQSIEMSAAFKVNGVDISELNKNRISLKNSAEHFGGLIINETVTVSGSFVAYTINGLDLWDLHQNIVTTDQSSEILSDIRFTDLHVTGSVTTENKIGSNGFNISWIDENAVHLDSNNTMTGNATWVDLVLQSNVTVEGLVSGVDLQALSNDAVYRDTDTIQKIHGKKTFEKGFHVKGDIDTETINGIDLREMLLTLHTDQNITANYAFRDLMAQRNLTLDGAVNGIDIDEIVVISLMNASNGEIVHVNFHNEVNVSHMDIRDTLNNASLDVLLNDAIRLRDEDVVVTGKKTFNSNITFGNVTVQNLNDRDFDAFVRQSVFKNASDVRLPHGVVVEGIVTAPSVASNSISVQDTIDGVNHKYLLENVIYINRDYHFNENITFLGSISCLDNINVTSLNQANIMTDYLLISVKQNFTDVTVNNLFTTDVAVEGTVNGYFLPQETGRTMRRVAGQTMTGVINILGSVEVLNHTHVTGRTGNHDSMTDLSEQVVLLDSDAVIQGIVTFLKPLRASSVKSTRGVLSGVDVERLIAKAWYRDTPVTVTTDLHFTTKVTIKEGLECNSENSTNRICEIIENTKSALSMFESLQNVVQDDFEAHCPETTSLFGSLQNAIYEGDYFALVRESSTPFVHLASTSFTFTGTTFIVMSWDGRCDSTLFKFNSTSEVIDPVQTVQNSGLGLDWVFIDIGEQLFVVMASQTNDRCSKANTVVWQMINETLSFYQDLHPGERISKTYLANGDIKLIIHSVASSWVYLFNSDSRRFVERETLSRRNDLTATLTTRQGLSFLLWSSGGLGSIAVEGRDREVEVMDVEQVEDAALVEHHNGRVFLVATVSQSWSAWDTRHNIELYSVDIIEGKVKWEDSVEISSPASLTTFYAGNEESGDVMIIVLQKYEFPAVYTIHGERLRILTELRTPSVRWALPLTIPGHTFPSVPTQYVVLGQKGNGLVLAHLEMKGRAVPRRNLTCDPEELVNLREIADLEYLI